MKKLLIIALLGLTLSFSPKESQAWGNIGIPDPVTWVIHGALGFGIAWYIDKNTKLSKDAGMIIPISVGIAKEVSDINFSVPDALGWGLGAALYYYQKDMIVCPEVKSELYREDWYTVYFAKTLKDCPK